EQRLAERSTGAAVGVQENAEAGRADARRIDELQHPLAMPLLRSGAFAQPTEFVVAHECEGIHIEKLLDLLALGRGQDGAIGSEELQAIPWGGIVAGGNLDGAGSVELAHGQAARRRRSD